MKTMTCSQMGGPDSCGEKFHAENFEEMIEKSKAHGMEMFQKGDEAHAKVMEEMKGKIGDPEAMKNYMESKKKLFDETPEDN